MRLSLDGEEEGRTSVMVRRVEEVVVFVGGGGGGGRIFASPLPFASSSSGPFLPLPSLSSVDIFFSVFFSRHHVVSLGRTARPVESLMCG